MYWDYNDLSLVSNSLSKFLWEKVCFLKHYFYIQVHVFIFEVLDMIFQFFWAGIIWGILASLGVWPVTLLVVHRTLHKGWIFGILSGLGIALADVIYAILSRVGLVFLQEFVEWHQFWFHLFISILFLIIGVYIFFSHKKSNTAFHAQKNRFKNFFTAFVLNIANVFNILLLGIIFAKLLPLEANTARSEIFLILGVAVGTVSWRIILSYTLSHFKIKVEKIYILNRILGILIFLWWIITLVDLFFFTK